MKEVNEMKDISMSKLVRTMLVFVGILVASFLIRIPSAQAQTQTPDNSNQFFLSNLAWSPDDKVIAVQRQETTPHIYEVNIETKEAKKLVTGLPSQSESSPQYGKSGLYFQIQMPDGGHLALRPTGSTVVQVLTQGFNIGEVAASPLTDTVAMQVINDKSSDVFIHQLSGVTQKVSEDQNVFAYHPEWDEKGQDLVFIERKADKSEQLCFAMKAHSYLRPQCWPAIGDVQSLSYRSGVVAYNVNTEAGYLMVGMEPSGSADPISKKKSQFDVWVGPVWGTSSTLYYFERSDDGKQATLFTTEGGKTVYDVQPVLDPTALSSLQHVSELSISPDKKMLGFVGNYGFGADTVCITPAKPKSSLTCIFGATGPVAGSTQPATESAQ